MKYNNKLLSITLSALFCLPTISSASTVQNNYSDTVQIVAVNPDQYITGDAQVTYQVNKSCKSLFLKTKATDRNGVVKNGIAMQTDTNNGEKYSSLLPFSYNGKFVVYEVACHA